MNTINKLLFISLVSSLLSLEDDMRPLSHSNANNLQAKADEEEVPEEEDGKTTMTLTNFSPGYITIYTKYAPQTNLGKTKKSKAEEGEGDLFRMNILVLPLDEASLSEIEYIPKPMGETPTWEIGEDLDDLGGPGGNQASPGVDTSVNGTMKIFDVAYASIDLTQEEAESMFKNGLLIWTEENIDKLLDKELVKDSAKVGDIISEGFYVGPIGAIIDEAGAIVDTWWSSTDEHNDLKKIEIVTVLKEFRKYSSINFGLEGVKDKLVLRNICLLTDFIVEVGDKLLLPDYRFNLDYGVTTEDPTIEGGQMRVEKRNAEFSKKIYDSISMDANGWYTTWWGITVLIVSGVLLVVVIVTAICMCTGGKE